VPIRAESSGRSARRYRVRKVHRTVRHVEPWSVMKVSLIFYFCIWLIMLVAGAVLWRVAVSAGLIDNIEKFIKEIFALQSFRLEAGQIFRAYALGGLIMVVASTVFTVLLTILFNLISDLTGGIRVTVLEEESARPVIERSVSTGTGPIGIMPGGSVPAGVVNAPAYPESPPSAYDGGR
jgi:hypothetical protein